MHPILSSPARFFAYLVDWTIIAALPPLVLVRGSGLPPSKAAALIIPLAVIYSFMCLFAWYPCRFTPLQTSGYPRVVVTHALAAVAMSYVWLLIAEAVVAGLSRLPEFQGLDQKITAYKPLFDTGIMLYLLSVGLFYVLLALEASRDAEKRAMEARVLARDAELRALKAQVNPHFLFNSLHSISALTSVDSTKAREMCVTLADFLRKTLGLGEKATIPLEEELALVHRFLAVEKIRFGARLNLEENVEPETLTWMVPPLLLQPLVENAVWHGVANLPEGGSVRLDCRREGEGLSIRVENTFDPEMQARRNGVGLSNVRRRLEARYGNEATFSARPEGNCFRVSLTLPPEAKAAAK